jgi:hypothetical protein
MPITRLTLWSGKMESNSELINSRNTYDPLEQPIACINKRYANLQLAMEKSADPL